MSEKTYVMTDKCRFVPDKDLEEVLFFNMRASAYVYNKTLESSINRKNLVKLGMGSETLVDRNYTQKVLKDLKNNKNFLNDADSTCLQSSTNRLIKAYNGYYTGRTGFPRFKSRKKNPVKSITLKNNMYTTKTGKVGSLRWIDDKKFRINKLGVIKVKHKREINGKIKEATILHENNSWYICIVYELEKIPIPEDFEDGIHVGIDLGITDFLTFSDGRVDNQTRLKES